MRYPCRLACCEAAPSWEAVWEQMAEGAKVQDNLEGIEDLAAFLEEKHRPIIQIPENHCSYPSFLHP